MFSSVAYKDLGTVPAQVNRKTGELFINPMIWKNIPKDHKDFILLHEKGHLQLMTDDEYQVNRYAVGKYLEAGSLDDSEFNRRIVILSEVLSDDESKYLSNASTDTNLGGIGGLISPIVESLAILGIGSKSRQEEKELSIKAAEEKAAANQKLLIIGGVFLIVLLVIFLILR